MSRIAAAVIAAIALTSAGVADACSCVPYHTQAEADRAGEEIWRNATLIVEATVGDTSAAYKALCPAPGTLPSARTIGRTMNADRPFTVHRVFKGRAPARPVLAGAKTEVYAQGCGVMVNSCEVGIETGSRTILVLNRTKDGRFEMMSYCGLMALRQSTRGGALFGAM